MPPIFGDGSKMVIYKFKKNAIQIHSYTDGKPYNFNEFGMQHAAHFTLLRNI